MRSFRHSLSGIHRELFMLKHLTVAIAALAISVAPATACKGDKVLFDDDFSTLDRTWGTQSEQLGVKGGRLVVKPASNMVFWSWNPGFTFDDADACVTVSLVETSDPTNSGAGLMFWVKDNANFYVMNIASNGYYKVNRKVAGKWAADPIPWTQTDAINQGPSQSNVLRVTTRGQSVTLAVNDKEVARFRAQAPDGPTYVGVFATSAKPDTDTWAFANLKVTNVRP